MTEFQVLASTMLMFLFVSLWAVHMLVADDDDTPIFLYLMGLDLVGMYIADFWQDIDAAAVQAVHFFLAIAGQTW